MKAPISVDLSMPKGINPRTGVREYTEAQLRILQPRWRREWARYSDLDKDHIDYAVNEIHTGPFHWPGTRIAQGVQKAMRDKMKEISRRWDYEGRPYSGPQLHKEAKNQVNAYMRKRAESVSMDEDDPFSAEYYLPSAERKKHRSWSWGGAAAIPEYREIRL